jgi:hypothetical protein
MLRKHISLVSISTSLEIYVALHTANISQLHGRLFSTPWYPILCTVTRSCHRPISTAGSSAGRRIIFWKEERKIKMRWKVPQPLSRSGGCRTITSERGELRFQPPDPIGKSFVRDVGTGSAVSIADRNGSSSHLVHFKTQASRGLGWLQKSENSTFITKLQFCDFCQL